MNRIVTRQRAIIFTITIVEIVLLAVFAALYLTNTWGLEDSIKGEYIIIGVAVLFVFDFIMVWICIWKIGKIKSTTDLKAAEIIGSDIQEAYNFAQVGLAVTDENFMVLWTNELFNDRHIDIIDSNILEWHGDLKELTENPSPDKVTKILINSRNYDVKYLAEAGLWIFKDETDFETTLERSLEKRPVVGLLCIDNYQDLVRGEEDFNDTVTRIKNIIFDYSKKNRILLRRIKDDTYSLFLDYDSFEKIKSEGFTIVDTVREVGSVANVPLTISIGIAYNYEGLSYEYEEDFVKLNDLANDALEMAMSRGGDQVVVNQHGQEVEYYGGKTEVQEKRNRVQTRVLADTLVTLINASRRSKVFIMGHTALDLDAFGACLGIKAICDRCSVESRIVIDNKLVEQKTKAVINSSFSREDLNRLIMTPKEAMEELNTDSLLVVVDVHSPSLTLHPPLVDAATKIVVIDHHRRSEDIIDSPVLSEIDSSASSSCEIVAEMIKYCSLSPRVELPSLWATIMLSGIFLDTRYFKSKKTGLLTFDACSILKEYGADNGNADDFLKDDYEEFSVVSSLMSRLKTPVPGVVYAAGDPSMIYETATLAKAADQCLTMKGNHAVFVIGKTGEKEIRMSARSDGTINVQFVAEKLGGGGHYSSAAATFTKGTIDDVVDRLITILEDNINAIRVTPRSRLSGQSATFEEDD
ncbi:MAG: DHH family phosphoesterase [Coprobacillus sp.]|nr:DHH family phosphoesterase [Coprobacillus sp.]